MKRRNNIDRLWNLMEEIAAAPKEVRIEPKVNDDGQIDEKDVEIVQKEARKKKVVKQEVKQKEVQYV